MKLKAFVFLCYAIFSLQSLSAFAAADKPFVIAVIQEWDIFHPISYQTASSEAFMHFFQRNMTRQAMTGQVVAEAAVEVPTLKNKKVTIIQDGGKKKVRAVWQIRPEVAWGDKTPVTCADWKFSWEVGMNDNVSKTEKGFFSKIEKIEWADKEPKKCTVTYVSDEWTFDRDLPPFLPLHLEKSLFDQWKHKTQAYEQNSNYVKNPSLPGLYNGPYMIEEIKPGSHVSLKVNPNFWGEKPQIQKIVIKHYGDPNALRPNLESHQVDMISAVGFPPDMAIAMSEEKSSLFKVHFIQSPLYQGLFFNSENEIMKDLAIRKAIGLAVNKEEITKAFFKGALNPAYTIISEGDRAFKDLKKKSDLNQAKKILDEAGWKLGADGKRSKDGKKLTVEFRTSAGLRVLETIQTYICAELNKANMDCVAKNQPPRLFLGETVPHGDFAVAMFGQATYPDSSLKGLFGSNEIPSEKNAWAGGNSTRIRSEKMDAVLKKFDMEWDQNKRIKLLQEIDQLIRENAWVIPLYHRREAVAIPAKMSGFTDDLKGTAAVFPERWKL